VFVCQVSCMLCVRSALHIDRGSPLLASRVVLLVFVPVASRIPCRTRRYEKPLVSRSTAEVFYNRQKSPGVWCSWFDVARTQELPFLPQQCEYHAERTCARRCSRPDVRMRRPGSVCMGSALARVSAHAYSQAEVRIRDSACVVSGQRQ